MDRDTAIQRIQRGLGFRTDLSSEIALAMQEQQRLLELGKTLPWFLLQEDQILTLPVATRSVNLPTGFIRMEDEGFFYTSTEDGEIEVIRRPYAEARDFYADRDAGGPEAYSLRKTSFYFFPEPDTGYSLTYSYYKQADVLTTNVENAWLAYAPEVLIGAAGVSIATDVRDATAVQTFTALYTVGMNALMAEIAAREENNMPRALGRNN